MPIASSQQLDDLLTARMGGEDAFAAMSHACDDLIAQLGGSKPPIKLAPLARLLGAKLNYGQSGFLGHEEAAVRFVDGELSLCVSRRRFEMQPRRARFSIAHEIGHLLLFKMLGPEFVDHSDSSDSLYSLTERLCDFAASKILMPRSYLENALKARRFSFATLCEIEDLFDVSSGALLKALADMIADGVIFELRKFRRREAEAVTWRIWNTSTSSKALGLSSWLPPGCTMKHIGGLTTPGLLPLAEPVFHSELVLVRGKEKAVKEGIAVRDICATSPAQGDLLKRDRTRLHASSLFQDEASGRVVLIAGKRGSLDPSRFGAGA